MEGEGPKRLQLSATGPADVTAGDIALAGDIQVMNPDLVICHLDEGASFNMELIANTGKGYVPAVANRPGGRSDRSHSGRRALFAGAPGRLQSRECPYRPGARLRPPQPHGRDGRHGEPRGRGRLCCPHPAGPAPALRPLRGRAADGRPEHGRGRCGERGRRRRHQPDQPLPPQEGGRAGTVGAFGPTASRTTTSSTSATWSRRPRPRCSARRTSAASRSTRSRKS